MRPDPGAWPARLVELEPVMTEPDGANEQLDLFTSRAARATDPVTSHLAAHDAARTAATMRILALEALREAGERGLTDFELAEILGRQQTSAGKRRGELRDVGLVRDSGMKRPAPSGSAAIVWVATDV